MGSTLEAFFHSAARGGQRLYLLHLPPAEVSVRAAVLYVHPWAEEMNKSRRMASLASRMLAESGCAVLQADMLGCGDSSGEFSDASWDDWLNDVVEAAGWLAGRHPGLPLWLWGLRTGAMLATLASQSLETPPSLLFWQPTPQGKTVWQQFLRIKAASQLADGGGKAILEAAKADMAAGRTIEVAGYPISPVLVHGLEAARLDAPDVLERVKNGRSPKPRVVWLEVVGPTATTEVSVAARSAESRWQAAGWTTEMRAVAGPAFWQTTEIEDSPALLEATIEALAG